MGQSHWTGTNNRNAATRLDISALLSMNRACKRFNVGALLWGKLFWHLVDSRGGRFDILSECPVGVHADLTDLLAEEFLLSSAEVTVTAGQIDIRGHVVANVHEINCVADGDDVPGELMPGNQRKIWCWK